MKLSDLFHQRVVLDASVISKVFLNEEYAEKVRQIISMHDKKELTIEDVVYLGDLV